MVGRRARVSAEEKKRSGYSPDILTKGLDVIFCGMNPATTAASDGHNFSNPNNRFWATLHLAGFTARRLQPCEEWRLLEYGCGITVAVDRPTSRADEILPSEFKRARSKLEAKISHYAPRAIAFLGKRAFSYMMEETGIIWGPQRLRFAETSTWVLPNPSGRNRSFTFDALVTSYAKLHMTLSQPHIS